MTSFVLGDLCVAGRSRFLDKDEYRVEGQPPSWSPAAHAPPPLDQPPWGEEAVAISGWPMRCFASDHRGLPQADTRKPMDWQTAWGIPLRTPWTPGFTPPMSIPLRPLPLGLIVSTLAWSPVGFIFIALARHLHTRSRRRRGLCTNCGYAIVGVTRCPECGLAEV